MSKGTIATILFRMKKTGQSLISISGQLFSADELLSMYTGRLVEEDIGQQFIAE